MLPRADPGGDQHVRALRGVLAARRRAERGAVSHQLLHPLGELVLGGRFLDRAVHRASTRPERDRRHGGDQHDAQSEHQRVVEGEDQQAGEGLEQHAAALEQQPRAGLLERDDVEVAVHEGGRGALAEAVGGDAREAVREIDAGPHEHPALQHLREVGLERRQGGADRQAHQQHQGQHDHGLDQSAEGDGVHQLLDRDRNRERQQTDQHRVEDDREDVAPFRAGRSRPCGGRDAAAGPRTRPGRARRPARSRGGAAGRPLPRARGRGRRSRSRPRAGPGARPGHGGRCRRAARASRPRST